VVAYPSFLQDLEHVQDTRNHTVRVSVELVWIWLFAAYPDRIKISYKVLKIMGLRMPDKTCNLPVLHFRAGNCGLPVMIKFETTAFICNEIVLIVVVCCAFY